MWVRHCEARPFLDFNFIIQQASNRRKSIIVYRDSLCLLHPLVVVDTAQLSNEYKFEYIFTDNHSSPWCKSRFVFWILLEYPQQPVMEVAEFQKVRQR